MKFIAFVLSLLIFGLAQSNTMLKEGTVIRDAEIESILRSYIDPIFQQAKLNTKDLNLVLVVNSENNAAATLNTTMILNTGFLLSTSNLNEIVGVIAHEVGHLEGRHVVRSIGAMENAQRVGLLGAAAGIALGVLTQRLDLGAALAIGSSISSIYGYLKYSRAEEAAADQAAVRYLNGLCWPADGLVFFFKKLLGQELLSTNLQDPYIRSHPLTRDRMHAIERQIQNSCQKPFPAQMVSRYHLMRIKLEAFLLPPAAVTKKYHTEETLNQYARAIAFYRQGYLDKAIDLLNKVKADYPEPAYIDELMGQIYYENGKIDLSIQNYKRAISKMPHLFLFHFGLAQSLVAKNTPDTLKEAEKILEKLKKEEPTNIGVWQFLSVVYGRQKQMGAMALALAEKEILLQNWQEADQQAKRALHFLKPGSVLYLRAQDLKIETKRETNKSTQTRKF